jgi:putative ABC transport system permease protein
MVNKAMFTDLYRAIIRTFPRFLSITAIIALGVGFYAGINATSPDMQLTLDQYYRDTNLMDARLLSPLGFKPEDIEAIRSLEGISDVRTSHTKDLFSISRGEKRTVRLFAYEIGSEDIPGTMNRVILIEGRFPENDREILLDDSSNVPSSYAVGDVVTMEAPKDEALEDSLRYDTYTIVGKAQSPMYIDLARGQTNIGDGSIDFFFLVPSGAFSFERITEIYVTGTDLSAFGTYTDQYAAGSDALSADLGALGKERIALELAEFYAEIEDGWTTLNEEKTKAYAELDDALFTLNRAEEDLRRGEVTLRENEKRYRAQIALGKRDLAEGRDALEAGRREIAAGRAALDAGKRELAEGRAAFESGRQQVIAARAEFEAGRLRVEAGRAALEAGRQELLEGRAALDAGRLELAEGRAALVAGRQEIAAGRIALEAGRLELIASREALDLGWQEYETNLAFLEAAEEQLRLPLLALTEMGRLLALMEGYADQGDAGYEALLAYLISQEDAEVPVIPEIPVELIEEEIDLGGISILLGQLQEAYGEQYEAVRLRYGLPAPEGIEDIDGLQVNIEKINLLIRQFNDTGDLTEAELAQLKALLDENRYTYAQLKEEYDRALAEMTTAQAAIDAGYAELEAGRVLLEEGEREIAAGEAEIEAREKQLIAAEKAIEESEQQLILGEQELAEKELVLIAGEQAFLENERLVIAGEQELAANERPLVAAEQELAESERILIAGEQEIAAREAELVAGERKLEESERQIIAGEKELADSERRLNEEIAAGFAKLEQGRADYLEGLRKYEDGLAEAGAEFLDAENELKDAESELEDIRKEWYVYTRADNPGYSNFKDDSIRIGAVAKVFPLFFFLVASLVCLTTMTRMVEEERTQIGTLKALGYKKNTIAAKYLVYALAASSLGSFIGLTVGFRLFPTIIMSAYNILYSIPGALTPFHWNYALVSFGLATFVTLIAAYFATSKEMKENPSQLMQPKAPAPGKKILFERIPFLWNRLSFMQKVTTRNLFRYKKRFYMTVLGISGCTALLLTGFGLRDSILAIMGTQYDTIFTYDAMVVLDSSTVEENARLIDSLSGITNVDRHLPIVYERYNAYTDDPDDTHEITLVTPQDIAALPDYIVMNDRESKETVTVPEEGVVVSEKLALLFHLKPGDTFTLESTDEETVTVEVADITENYIQHYVYMTESYYSKVFGSDADSNAVLVHLEDVTSEKEQVLGETLLENESVIATLFLSGISEEYQKSLSSFNLVVLVLIIAAGALAFVVLFNLTNINITERLREIATIKVLGFRDQEVSSYVFRENMILSFFGSLVGLVLGYIMHKYVISTMELDYIMFGRDVLWPSYVYSILLTLAFSLMVNQFMYFKLRKINMVESLKSAD